MLIPETVFGFPPYTIWPNLFPPPCWAEFQNCTLTRMALYRRLPDVLMMLLKGMMMIVDDCHFESAYLQELRAWVFFSTALEWCSWSCSGLISIPSVSSGDSFEFSKLLCKANLSTAVLNSPVNMSPPSQLVTPQSTRPSHLVAGSVENWYCVRCYTSISDWWLFWGYVPLSTYCMMWFPSYPQDCHLIWTPAL